jgi:23S rRNA pseudouridine1911/1915/1917 synthase
VTELTVPAALAGERVDRGVALLTGWTRSQISRLCDEGAVRVDDRAVPRSRRLATGEVVEILGEPELRGEPGPEAVPVDVRYADEDVVVVAKPAGTVVHPGAAHHGGTLVNGLLARFPELAAVGDPTRPGIVHRLDRDTSGLIVVARSRRSYDALVAALARREIDRRYVALVWGHPDARRAVVDAPVGRSRSRRTRMAVREGGRAARTEYAVRRTFMEPAVALLDCRLETGRTHQIRVHLAALGHPVVGDGAYGGDRQGLAPGRPFLHAAALAFAHPVTGERLEIEEPLPADLDDVLQRLHRPGA